MSEESSVLETRELMKKYGTNPSSFLSLYSGFSYFRSPDPACEGVIPYLNTSQAWVAAGGPICSPENELSLLKIFAEEAKKKGKSVVVIPVSKKLSEDAKNIGYGRVMVGGEPFFLLDQYPPTGNTSHDIVPAAKQLYAKGARVTELKVQDLHSKKRDELDSIVKEWFDSRKMGALGFLNRVEPWTHIEDKRYFVIELEGQTLAFVAGIPIWGRNAWYLIDVMRRKSTPAGTTELLLLEAMKTLKESGVREVTLGVAPLSHLENAPRTEYPLLYKLLGFIFEKMNAFYNFKSLYQFKHKFKPTTYEDAYIISYPGSMGIRGLRGLSAAYFPGGLMGALWSGVVMWFKQFRPSEVIKWVLSDSVVVRSAPPSVERLLKRCQLTAALLVLYPVLFVFLGGWNGISILKNILMLVLFAGGLEYLAGTETLAWCFGVPLLLTSVISYFTFGGRELGPIYGAMGCVGALSLFLKKGTLWFILSIVTFALWAAVIGTLQPLAYSLAMFFGFLIEKYRRN